MGRCSGFVGPLGIMLATPGCKCEATQAAEFDPTKTVRGKRDFDATGHYTQAEVKLDERPMPSVAFTADGVG